MSDDLGDQVSQQESVQEDSDSGFSFDAVVNWLTKHAFSTLYVMNREVERSSALVTIVLFVEFFQLLSFPFYSQQATPFPWNSLASWIGQYAGYTRIYSIYETSFDGIHAAFFVCIAILGLNLINAIAVAVQFALQTSTDSSTATSSASVRNGVLVRLLRLNSSLLIGPFYIPMIGTFMLQIMNPPSGGSFTGGSTQHIIYAVFGAVLIVLQAWYCFFISSTWFSRLPTDDGQLSRPNSVVSVALLLAKTVLPILFIGVRSLDSSWAHWVMIGSSFAFYAALLFILIWYQPYYRHNYNMVHGSLIGLCAWSSFVGALNELIANAKSPGISLMLYVMMPLFLIAILLVMNMRRSGIERASILELDNSFEVELKVRWMLSVVTEEIRASKASNMPVEPARKKQHDMLIGEMERILGFGIKRFADSRMLIVRALYSLAYLENRGLAINSFARAEMRGPSLEETFCIFFYRRFHEEEFAEDERNADILNYMAFQKAMADARRYDESATKYQLQFWDELLKANTDTNRMSSIALSLNTNMVAAQDCYRRLLRMNGNSAQVLRTYASFLIDIANEASEGNKLLIRAEDVEDRNAKAHERGGKENANNSAALFDDRNALISIAGELKNAGEITNVNAGVARMFGYTRSDMLGRNVAMIMPPPYSSSHQGFLMKYLETGQSHILGSTRVVFGLHRSGWLLPLEIFVREISSAEGASFLAVLRRPNHQSLLSIVPSMAIEAKARALARGERDEDEVDEESSTASGDSLKQKKRGFSFGSGKAEADMTIHFAFADLQQRVTSCSVGCVGLFGGSMEEVRANLVTLANWVPAFSDPEKLKQIRSPNGLRTVIKTSSGRVLNLHVIQALLEINSESVFVVQFGEFAAVAKKSESRSVDEEDGDVNDEEADASEYSEEQVGDDEEDEDYVDEEEEEDEELDEEVSEDAGSQSEEAHEDEEHDGDDESDSKHESDERLVNSSLSKSGVQFNEIEMTKVGSKPLHPPKPLSQHSGSSKSSGTSSMTSTGALHQRLVSFARSRDNRNLSDGIQRLRFSLVMVLLFVCVIAIARFTLMDSQVADFSLRMNSLFMAGSRRYLSMRLVLMAHVLLMGPLIDPDGNYWPNFWTEEQVAPARDVMEYDCQQLEAINNVLYIQRRSQLSTEHDNLYTSNAVTTWHTRDTTVVFPLPMSLWDSTQMLITQSRVYSKMRILDIIDTNPTVYYVLRNGIARSPGELFYALNQSCFMYQQDALSSLNSMRSWAIAFLVVGIVAVIFVAFVIVRPKVLVVEQNKEAVLMLFADVPQNLIGVFHRKTQKRLNQMKAAAQGVEIEDEDDEVEQVDGANLVAEADGNEEEDGQGGESGDQSEHEAQNPDAASAATSAAGSSLVSERALRRAKKKADRIQTNSTFVQRNVTMFKVSAIVILTLIYYIASYIIEYGQFARSLERSPGQVNWSQHRRLSLLLLVYDLRHILTQKFWKLYEAGSQDIVDVTESGFFSDLALLTDMETAMAFGSDRFMTDPPVPGIQEKLMFEPDLTCSTFATWLTSSDWYPRNPGFSLDTCKTFGQFAPFGYGVVNKGLHASILEFGNVAHQAFFLINNTLGPNPGYINGEVDLKLCSSGNFSLAVPMVGGTKKCTAMLADTPGLNKLTVTNPVPPPTDPKNYSQVMKYMTFINAAFHSTPMEWLKNASEQYIPPNLDLSGAQYATYVDTLYSNVRLLRTLLLVIFIVLCFLLYVFFYSPMLWGLDAEEKQTSAMLLMIPVEFMDKIPSIKQFVQNLDVKV